MQLVKLGTTVAVGALVRGPQSVPAAFYRVIHGPFVWVQEVDATLLIEDPAKFWRA